MLRAEIRHFQPISCSWDTMTTRSAALASISLTVVLLALVAVAAIFSGEISERNLGIVTTVLASLGTVMTGLLIFLRLETVHSKADEAAANAKAARHETAVMKGTVERVHYDLLNGGLRDNVKRALREGSLEQAMRDEMQRRAEEKPT